MFGEVRAGKGVSVPGHSIMLAEVFVGCQTMFPSTSPKVVFVVYMAPASVKFARVLSSALNRQN